MQGPPLIPKVLLILASGSLLLACDGTTSSSAPDPCKWVGGECDSPMQNAPSGAGRAASAAPAITGGQPAMATAGAASGNSQDVGQGADTAANSEQDSGSMEIPADAGTAADAGDRATDAATETPPPDFTLVVDTPSSGTTVSGQVTVRGKAPGFLNVEVWDATHQSPPLAQVVPGTDGSFELTVDASSLSPGQTSWTVHAWDSPPGQSFDHTDSVVLQLEIEGAGGQSSSDGVPDPGTRYVPSGYQLAFSDEFNGSTLDSGTWNTLAPWGVQFYEDSRQKQAFIPEGVSVGGGVVTFTARRSAGSDTNGQPYSSGSITSNGTFTHGYFEARVKVPSGKGFWPAYWLTSSTRWPPEWDIFEIIDGVIFGYPHPIQSGLCQFVEGAAGGDSTYIIDGLYDVYHVYGFHWTSSDLYWYVDGVLTEHWMVNAAAGADDPYWLNLSLQVGGDWPGDPDGSTPFPGRMEVDYVRVYQQN